MRILGVDIVRGGPLGFRVSKALRSVSDRGSWSMIFDSTPGAWQRNISTKVETVQAFSALFGILTLVSGDIGKLGLRLMRREGRVWVPIENSAHSPVLRKPNRYQTRSMFFAQWVLSLLQHGNAYILKERDKRGLVTALHVLDPQRVKPLVSDTNGSVFYQLGQDALAQVQSDIPTAPASEVIHDRINCLFHPLIGVSPIFACGLAAQHGLAIQGTSAQFFENGARPGGILSAPGIKTEQEAERLKKQWDSGFSGAKAGSVAVLTGELKYEAVGMVNAVDAELIAQLKLSAEMVCSAFHVPAYKVGVGPMPTYQNAEVLNQIYYTDCLQGLIEGIEAALDEGLGIGPAPTAEGQLRVEFDLSDLLRMDQATAIKTLGEGVAKGIHTPNEARERQNLPPIEGGDAVYLQQQNFSTAALAKRDALPDPFSSPAAPAPPPEPPADPTKAAEAQAVELLAQIGAAVDAELKAGS